MTNPPRQDLDLVVCHDAGGAEILSAMILEQGLDCRCVVAGPAEKIFRRKMPGRFLFGEQNLSQLALESRVMITGTSWASDLERLAIRQGLHNGARVISYLDHWVNFRERFHLDSEWVWPHEIWVGDRDALTLAEQTLPDEIQFHLHPNPYFEEIRRELATFRNDAKFNKNGLNVLYCAEPLAEHALIDHGRADFFGYDEFSALRGYLSDQRRRRTEGLEDIHSIRFRLHPSEAPEKYQAILSQFPDLPLEPSCGLLLADCEWADRVVGCETMAMVVGLLAGKEVFSVIPRGGRPCQLPHREIVHLFNTS